jgi:hypothetical protein
VRVRVSIVRILIGCVAILPFPEAVHGQDAQGAMLYPKGNVWVNGKQLPASSAVLSGDTIETEESSAANISVPGTAVVIQQSSVAKFEGNTVGLQRGTVNVVTTTRMRVHAEHITATPTSNDQTDFEVTDQDGKVSVAVHKNKVEVNCGKEVTEVDEGQDVTPDENGRCKAGAYPARSKGLLANPWLWGGAAAAGGIIGIIIGVTGGGPASPSAPGGP